MCANFTAGYLDFCLVAVWLGFCGFFGFFSSFWFVVWILLDVCFVFRLVLKHVFIKVFSLFPNGYFYIEASDICTVNN